MKSEKIMIKIINGEFETFIFSGGEVHVRIIDAPVEVTIEADLKSSDEIMMLLLLVNALRNSGHHVEELIIYYFPYSRQDRVCNQGEALSVKVMADLINSMNIPLVSVYDPHSDVIGALINNCEVILQCAVILKYSPLNEMLHSHTIICPDAGAEKKIIKLGVPYVLATKVRDPKTGDIIQTKIFADSLEGKDCLIIDDICDGGRTFIELAKILKEKGARSVTLYVTHGIFSKGFDVFKGYIDTIYYFNLGELTCESIH